ncbi:MAG TPA: DUF2793 domain-containing protein [Sphingomonadaceae bacterium]
MPDPISFTSTTPRLCLPLLFVGQAGKEFYVNEAHARIDALLHSAIEGEANDPPASPADGACWLVGGAPTGGWAGHAGDLACSEAGTWLFVAPRDGMRLLDRSTGQLKLFRSGWIAPAGPALPAGGATVDAEARGAIGELVSALVEAGILAA